RHRVDDVLAVAEHEEVVVGARGGAEELEHGFQLAHVVGAVLPPTGGPVLVVDVPGPPGRPGVAEGGSVGRCGDRHRVIVGSAVREAGYRRRHASAGLNHGGCTTILGGVWSTAWNIW